MTEVNMRDENKDLMPIIGILNGMLLGAVLWAILGFLGWHIYQAINTERNPFAEVYESIIKKVAGGLR